MKVKKENLIGMLILIMIFVIFPQNVQAAGNTFKQATSISLGTNYRGTITNSNRDDWYKFTISSSGKVTMTATANIERICYTLYDSNGEELKYNYAYWNDRTEQSNESIDLDLTKGTYYLEMHESRYTGNYSFKVSFQSAGESFTETGNGTNNSIYSANAISLNKTYKGQIALNDDVDFYKFTLNSSGNVRLTASAKMKYVYYKIYDSSGNLIWRNDYCWNDITQLIETKETISLTKGTYYFVVEMDCYSTGNYSFTLANHTHDYKKTVEKATLSSNGKITEKCSCGDVYSTKIIYYPKTISLSADRYLYDGAVKTPSVSIKDSQGKTIASSNYTITYPKGRKNVGKYNIKISFKGNYSGTATKTFKIYPKGTSISKIIPKSKGFTVEIKKQTAQTSGYVIEYSTSRNFSGCSSKEVKNTTTSVTFSKLRSKQTYYVRVMTIKTVGNVTYVSPVSDVKMVTTK
jgi:hypothetical protein